MDYGLWIMNYQGKANQHKSIDVEERFWSKVNKTDSCWEWTCSTDRGGYGLFGVNYKQWRAHRFAKHITHGLDDDKPIVMHTCDNPKCVNPDHLVNGTNKENMEDRNRKGRHVCHNRGKKRQADGSYA